VIQAPRGAQSEKPEIVYAILEAMHPGLPKLELFARKSVPGWKVWGKQVNPSAG
jgi:N6-adenosine-specific RNA methylase IME4